MKNTAMFCCLGIDENNRRKAVVVFDKAENGTATRVLPLPESAWCLTTHPTLPLIYLATGQNNRLQLVVAQAEAQGVRILHRQSYKLPLDLPERSQMVVAPNGKTLMLDLFSMRQMQTVLCQTAGRYSSE